MSSPSTAATNFVTQITTNAVTLINQVTSYQQVLTTDIFALVSAEPLSETDINYINSSQPGSLSTLLSRLSLLQTTIQTALRVPNI